MFKSYQRKAVSEARPYLEGEVLGERVTISVDDREAGSPKVGDMIVRNPKKPEDEWLVSESYFVDNFEEV